MWNIPFFVSEYTGDRGTLEPNDPVFYVTIPITFPDNSTVRTFVAVLQDRSWERTRAQCLYAGNRQAGPIGDIPEDEFPNESVIEGDYTDYIVASEYTSDCTYCRIFSQESCGWIYQPCFTEGSAFLLIYTLLLLDKLYILFNFG